jgi:hypothetical protein
LYLPADEEHFGDFRYVLACAGFSMDEKFSFDCSNYMYGQLFLDVLKELTFLHSHGEVLIKIGVAFGLLSLSFIISNLRTRTTRFYAVLLFLSPPIALLVERANLDLVVFSICSLALHIYAQGSKSLPLFLLAIASVMKIYPVVLLLLVVTRLLRESTKPWVRAIMGSFALSMTWLALTDILKIPWLPSDARNSFGLRIFGEYLVFLIQGSGHQSSPVLATLLGVVILMLFSFASWKLTISLDFSRKWLRSEEETFWVLFFIAIFCSGISIDYRLVFLIPCLSFIEQCPKTTKYSLLALYSCVFVLSYPFGWAQVFGDVGLFAIVSLFIVILVRQSGHSQQFARLWQFRAENRA